MSICKNILCNITRKAVESVTKSTATKSNIESVATEFAYPNIGTLQKDVSGAFSKNIQEMEKFSQTEMPKVLESQNTVMETLEQLSKNIKSML